MLSRTATRERNALRALAQWEANLAQADTDDNMSEVIFRAEELAIMEYDSVMSSFNECKGIYGNVGETE